MSVLKMMLFKTKENEIKINNVENMFPCFVNKEVKGIYIYLTIECRKEDLRSIIKILGVWFYEYLNCIYSC